MALLLAIAVVGIVGRGGWPDGAQPVLGLVGAVLMVAGVVVAGMALTGLGSALTAMPAPLEGETLRTGGIYALVRHPIYGGLIVVALGFSLVTTPWALVPSAAVAVVLDLKRRVEEDFLTATYADYPDYRRAVRRALVPYVW
jgi:protein-S-isoprenylcysteine O-methyltransferase Ste14